MRGRSKRARPLPRTERLDRERESPADARRTSGDGISCLDGVGRSSALAGCCRNGVEMDGTKGEPSWGG